MAEKIYFNGRVYQSRAEMQPEVREAYDRLNKIFTDADGDGIPDLFQGKGLGGLKDAFGLIKEISISAQQGQTIDPEQFTIVKQRGNTVFINGKEFTNPDEMPDEIRKVYNQIVNNAAPGESNIFEESWRETNRDDYFKPHDDEIINPQPEYAPVMENVKTNIQLLIILIGAFVILVLGAGLWLLMWGGLPGS